MKRADNIEGVACAIAGPMSYRVTKQGRIESVTGKTPRCRHCGKRLRPNYQNQFKQITKYYLYSQQPDGPAVEFDSVLGKWRQTVITRELVSRKFLGTFGKHGDGFFCNHVCASAWALETMKRIDAGSIKLVDCATKAPAQR